MPTNHFYALLEIATENEGLVTTSSALDAGISRRTLAGMVNRGCIERVARGMYRPTQFYRDPLAPYREAVLWAQAHRGPHMALSHESDLAILGLTDANPAMIQLTVQPQARLRRQYPARVAIHREALNGDDVFEHDGLPVTSLSRTVTDLARSGKMRFAGEAIVQGCREGYITKAESRRLSNELEKFAHDT